MAIILVLFCSVLGFVSATAAVLLFDVSLFQAFTLWMSAGFVALIFAVLPALLPQREAQDDRQAESA
jgi:hypothetical protein